MNKLKSFMNKLIFFNTMILIISAYWVYHKRFIDLILYLSIEQWILFALLTVGIVLIKKQRQYGLILFNVTNILLLAYNAYIAIDSKRLYNNPFDETFFMIYGSIHILYCLYVLFRLRHVVRDYFMFNSDDLSHLKIIRNVRTLTLLFSIVGFLLAFGNMNVNEKDQIINYFQDYGYLMLKENSYEFHKTTDYKLDENFQSMQIGYHIRKGLFVTGNYIEKDQDYEEYVYINYDYLHYTSNFNYVTITNGDKHSEKYVFNHLNQEITLIEDTMGSKRYQKFNKKDIVRYINYVEQIYMKELFKLDLDINDLIKFKEKIDKM